MSACLFRVELPWWQHVFTLDERELLRAHCVNPPKFTADGKLEAYSETLISLAGLQAFKHLKPVILEVIDNEATRSLSEYGTRTTTVVNERCNVAVSGLGLLTINEVILEQDCCTDKLSERLTEGWRIVAVCVQPDQRRPDYILGRTIDKPEK